MNKEQKKTKRRSNGIGMYPHGTIRIQEKSMKDSGHEEDIAECSRMDFEKRWSGRRRKIPSRAKEREQQNNFEYRERVRSGE
jgi:hypothetical protein